MATKEVVTKVWIEEGCIVCDACETACPEVFEVKEDTCVIRPAALSADFNKPRTESIRDAAEECPVDVIKFETVTAEVAGEAPAAKAEPAAEPEAPAEPKATAEAKKPGKPAARPAAAASAPAEGDADPAIAALLKAAATRGGNAGILRHGDGVDAWGRSPAAKLPPDARQARLVKAAKRASDEPDATRRTVAGSAALAVGWVAFGAGLGVSIGPAFGRFMMPNVLEEPDPRVRVGPLKNYLEMAPQSVNEDYKPQGIWMIRLEERIAALSDICTHLGCIPNWLPNDRKFKCPCHGSGYYLNGINFEGPTPRPLERFKLTVDENGIVIVDKSRKYRYELGQWDQKGAYIPV